jgi:hypothetical protein
VAETSLAGPPRSELFEPDLTVAVDVDRRERRVDLSITEAGSELIQQSPELRLVDAAVAVGVDTFEAVSQRIVAHALSLGRSARRTKRPLLAALLVGIGACQSARPDAAIDRASAEPHPITASEAPSASTTLPPLSAEWLERIGAGPSEIVVMAPRGAIEPLRLVIGVHGAGDRSDWACGGWRLGSAVSAIIACPRGSKLGGSTFAWSSATAIEAGVEHALEVVRARLGRYVADEPLIFAGFSQGATLAEPILRKHATRFPIAILAEGGYRTTESASFARSYRAAGGRRIVLLCGTPSCFHSAGRAQPLLERQGVEALVIGDPKASHNLNRELQQALQAAWPKIVAPLP